VAQGYEASGRLNRCRRVPGGCHERQLPDALAAWHDSVWKAPIERAAQSGKELDPRLL
jgi:hypothetical protein